ncbi:hypothetical protein J4Q44_G00367240 [Coregonus suidteri]|uniref:Ig-like domain-containing protein n=1 Tax=Coregonus suidteri TaxID=861788 RepID=A0AAN8QE86_9TELE
MACPENMFFLIGLFMSGVLACFGQRDLITTMPDRLDVLTGSCVQIPCAFYIPDQNYYKFNSTILTSGVWFKKSPLFAEGQDNVIFNSSEMVNSYQGKITGNMSQKNCTTVFFNVTTSYSDKYFFRIESQPYRATDPEKPVNIDVRVSPKDTSASISPAGPVLVGSCVNLICSSTANPPVTNFTWFQISGGKPTQVASGQSYTLIVTVGDGGLYYCEARNSQGCGKSEEVKLAIKEQGEAVNPKVYEIIGKILVLLFLFSLIVFFAWRRRTSRLSNGFETTDRS